MHHLIPESDESYGLSDCRPCTNIDSSWAGLQFQCIRLYQSLFETTGYPIAHHAQILLLAETVFTWHALSYTRAWIKLWVIRLQTMHKYWYSLRRSSISMHWRWKLKTNQLNSKGPSISIQLNPKGAGGAIVKQKALLAIALVGLGSTML